MTVIVYGVESPTGLAVIRDLGINGMYVIGVGYAMNAIGFHSKYCKEKLIRPKGNQETIEFFRDIYIRLQKKVPVIAIGESDIIFLNKLRADISDYCVLAFPSQDAMSKVLDKSYLQTIAQDVGISVPETFSVGKRTEVVALADKVTYPVVLKWSNPHDVISLLSDAGLALEKVEYCVDKESFIKTMTKYDRVGVYPMVQRYYLGKGVGYFFLCNDGKATVSYSHQRIHEWPPEGGASCLCQSLSVSKDDAIYSLSEKLLERLSWHGIAMVEFRYDEVNDDFVLMEINGRFWGSSPLFVAAKVYMATALVKLYLGEEIPPQAAARHVFARFMIPETKRLVRILFFPNKIKDPIVKFNKVKEFAMFLAYFFSFGMTYYVFSTSDPKPFVNDLKNGLKKLLKL